MEEGTAWAATGERTAWLGVENCGFVAWDGRAVRDPVSAEWF